MTFEHWVLAAILAAVVGVDVWALWMAYRFHQVHRILDDIDRRLLDLGGGQ